MVPVGICVVVQVAVVPEMDTVRQFEIPLKLELFGDVSKATVPVCPAPTVAVIETLVP